MNLIARLLIWLLGYSIEIEFTDEDWRQIEEVCKNNSALRGITIIYLTGPELPGIN